MAPRKSMICTVTKSICATMNLESFHVAELLYTSCTGMTTVFPYQPAGPVIHISVISDKAEALIYPYLSILVG